MRWLIIDNFSLRYQWRLQPVCPERVGKEHPQNKISKQIALIDFFTAFHIKHIRATICEHRVANANTSFNHQEPII